MARTIAVDFDGVIHAYSRGWADGSIYDPPLPGAIDALHTLMDRFAVFVHTTRDPEQVMPWLQRHGLDVTIDERCCKAARLFTGGWLCDEQGHSGMLLFWNVRGRLLVTNRKLPAVAYVDDRAVRFESWPQTLLVLAELNLQVTHPACCDSHGRHCEPPADLCCQGCTEARHPFHPPGVGCTWAGDADVARAQSVARLFGGHGWRGRPPR
jgi:hypothetical protein